MGKGTDLWDDSALVNAFDHAMATYKAMHRENYPVNPCEKENHTSESNQVEVALGESLRRGQGEHDNGENNLLKDVTETCMPYHKDIAPSVGVQIAPSVGVQSQEDNVGENVCAKESNPHLSEFRVITAETNNYNAQQSIEYNNLLRQYYDLEEQRQQVLQQLQQAYYWNDQNPVQPCEVQAHQVIPDSNTENMQQPPCSLCAHLHSGSPLIPASACALSGPSFGGFYCCSGSCFVSPHQLSAAQGHFQGGVCSVGTSCTIDLSKQTSQKDDNVARIGMMVAEKVLSSMKNEISQDSIDCEGRENGKEEILGEYERKSSGDFNHETDLSVVLSAWYSAGYHTGRYLSEQSRRRA